MRFNTEELAQILAYASTREYTVIEFEVGEDDDGKRMVYAYDVTDHLKKLERIVAELKQRDDGE